MDDATYYFCDLKSKDIICPKMHECKRYEPVKDIPYNKYFELGFAKLHNICNEDNGYKMFMQIVEIKNKPNTVANSQDIKQEKEVHEQQENKI